MKSTYARRSMIGAVMVTALMASAMVMPAHANSTFSQRSTEVSCDGTTVKSASTIDHNTNGDVTVRQNSTDPTSVSVVWLRSAAGNDTGTRTLSDGEQGRWTSVLNSTYTIRVRRSTSSNCNGISFGHGNYVWIYSGTYSN